MTHPDHPAHFSSEQFLHLAAETIRQAPLAVCCVDRIGRIRYGNTAVCVLLCYSVDELYRRTITDLVPSLNARAWKGVWESLPSQAPLRRELLCAGKSGSVVPVAITVVRHELDGDALAVVYLHELALSRARFMRLADDIPAFVTEYLPDCTLTYVNRALARLTGLTPEALLGTCFLDYLAPDVAADVKARLEALTPENPVATHEQTWVSPSGETRWHQWTNQAFFDACGCIDRYQAVGFDVTERRRTEQALRDSEARYRALAVHFPNGALFLFDDAFRYLAADGRGLEQAGLRSQDILGRTVAEVFPELFDTIRPHLEEALAGRESCYEVAYNGGIYANHALPIPGNRRRAIVVTQNVTAQRRTETALRESESRLNLALEVAQMGYWLWEIDTNRVHWSDGHEKLFGITIDEFGGTIDDVQRYVHPEDREQGMRNLRRTLEDRSPFDNTYRVVHPGGEIHWLHSYGYLYCDDRDRPVHIFGITQDITVRKRLEHTLIQAAEREQKRLGQELHDGLCQDLKSIEIESTLLERQLRRRQAVEADRAAHLASGVNRSVRTAYAMAQGMIPVGFDEQGLEEALHRLLQQTRLSCPAQCLSADVQPACFPPDRESAYHVFRIAQEALTNAVRHSGATEIALSWGPCVNRSGHLCLRVRDNGCGFSEMLAPASGMGLVVMRSRAESIGAVLDISQNPGGGTVVDCSLPAHRGDLP